MKKDIKLNSWWYEGRILIIGLIISPSIILIIISIINIIKIVKNSKVNSSNQISKTLWIVFILLGIIFNWLLIYNIINTGLIWRLWLLVIWLWSIIHWILLQKQKITKWLTILNILIWILIITIMYYIY